MKFSLSEKVIIGGAAFIACTVGALILFITTATSGPDMEKVAAEKAAQERAAYVLKLYNRKDLTPDQIGQLIDKYDEEKRGYPATEAELRLRAEREARNLRLDDHMRAEIMRKRGLSGTDKELSDAYTRWVRTLP